MEMKSNDITPFKDEEVNWEELASLGILRDELEISGELEALMRGEKTNVIYVQLILAGCDVIMEGTLQLVRRNGAVFLEITRS